MEDRRKAKAERVEKSRRGDADTWRVVAQEWLNKEQAGGAAQPTLRSYDWLIRMTVPALGGQHVAKITAPDLLGVLRQVRRPDAARRRTAFAL